ncbi:MAG TPA: hypothetical protein VL381_08950 [Rhodocyclaceae bacterium]|jgi:hypothetical protein|nr:hypothetical protein [Rhodocyclaceae bacterium]
MEFADHPRILILVGVLSIPVYVALAKMFWGERFESFGETIRFLFTPDIFSLFQGRFWDDWYATTKFNVFVLLCFAWVAAITELLARHVL